MKYKIPTNYNDQSDDTFSDWFSLVIKDFFHCTRNPEHLLEFNTIVYRFGLFMYSKLSLEEIGILYGKSKESIRQIEKKAIANLSELINTGSNNKRNISLSPSIFNQIYKFKNNIEFLDPIINEESIISRAKTIFSIVNVDIPSVRLLMTLLNYRSINLIASDLDESFIAWTNEKINSKRLKRNIYSVAKLLKKVIKPLSYEEIKLLINKKYVPKDRLSDKELHVAIQLNPEIEKINNLKYQIKYDQLKSMADKAYRILFNNDSKPIHYKELARQLNFNEFKAGNKSDISGHHVGVRLSNDKRFKSLGRSGEWVLSECEDYSTDYIVDLMVNSLHNSGKPLSSKQIYDYVSARRPVQKTAIQTYLGYEDRFARIDTDLYALSDWDLPRIERVNYKQNSLSISKAKLCDLIEKTFIENELSQMPLSQLSKEIAFSLYKRKPESLYTRIQNSPAVEIIKEKHGNKVFNIAKFNPNYRNKLSKREIIIKDMPMREIIQKSIRELLESQDGHKLHLSYIRDTISKKTSCPPSSVYAAIDKMEDIKKYKVQKKEMVCELLSISNPYIKRIRNISDKKIAKEIERALELVNIDGIDLGLFQLGKIFEYTLKKFILLVKEKGKFIVNEKDTMNLFSMIEWVKSNSIITNEKALHYLRIERNDRSHGIPPDIDERKVLLENSSTLINFYIDYIILLDNRSSKIET